MNIVAAAQHFHGVPMEIAVVILILERPRRDLGTRRLLAHVRQVLLAQGSIDRAESDVLIFAHRAALHVRLDDRTQLGQIAVGVERAAFMPQGPELAGHCLADRVAHVVPRHAHLLKLSRDAHHAFRIIRR